MVERFEAEMTYTIDTVQDLVRVLDEHPQWLDALRARMLLLAAKVSLLAEEMRQFKAAAERRFDQQDQRLGRVESRLDRVIDDLGPLKGAHAGNVARREAGLIALDLGLRYRKSLTSMELVSLSDAVDTTGIAANELRSFHRADVIRGQRPRRRTLLRRGQRPRRRTLLRRRGSILHRQRQGLLAGRSATPDSSPGSRGCRS